MVESKLTYEECRRQRLEENKKKLEELNLTKLAQALKTPTPKKSPVCLVYLFLFLFSLRLCGFLNLMGCSSMLCKG